jgi:hypothetical protein
LGAVTDQWDAHCVADNDDDETVGLFWYICVPLHTRGGV